VITGDWLRIFILDPTPPHSRMLPDLHIRLLSIFNSILSPASPWRATLILRP
jgi:hypothetical protein